MRKIQADKTDDLLATTGAPLSSLVALVTFSTPLERAWVMAYPCVMLPFPAASGGSSVPAQPLRVPWKRCLSQRRAQVEMSFQWLSAACTPTSLRRGAKMPLAVNKAMASTVAYHRCGSLGLGPLVSGLFDGEVPRAMLTCNSVPNGFPGADGKNCSPGLGPKCWKLRDPTV